MSEKEMQSLAEQIVYMRKLRSEMEERISHRSTALLTTLKLNKLLAPPPKGQKSPIYITQDGTTKVRLFAATKSRQWFLPNDPLVLERAKSVPIVGLSPEELILAASRFSKEKVREEFVEGRITSQQLQALYEVLPAKEWRVSVSQITAGGI